MPERTRRLDRTAAAALFAATAAWNAAGFFFPALPGWTMFSRAEPAPSRLVDRDGKEESLYALLPRDVYLIDADSSRAVAAFACRRFPERAPWRLRWDDGRTEAACPP